MGFATQNDTTVAYTRSVYAVLASSHPPDRVRAIRAWPLPYADSPDVGAGYAAASAATVAVAVYAGSAVASEAAGLATNGSAQALLAALSLPIAGSAAVLVGVLGWRVLPS